MVSEPDANGNYRYPSGNDQADEYLRHLLWNAGVQPFADKGPVVVAVQEWLRRINPATPAPTTIDRDALIQWKQALAIKDDLIRDEREDLYAINVLLGNYRVSDEELAALAKELTLAPASREAGS